MNSNNYYTPTIDEFHVGFEYEYRNHDGTIRNINNIEWKRSIVDSINHLAYVERGLNTPNNTRVKYLDKEDIESLGFVCTRDSEGEEKEFQLYGYSGEKGTPRLETCETCILLEMSFDNEITITFVKDRLELNSILFRGTIKNKSELKKLLKQLGIDGNKTT
jgi:hypothetical protein